VAKTSGKKMVIIMLAATGGVVLILLVLFFFKHREYGDYSAKIDVIKKKGLDKGLLEAEVESLEKKKKTSQEWNSEAAKLLPDDSPDVQDRLSRIVSECKDASKTPEDVVQLEINTSAFEESREASYNNVKRYSMKILLDGTIVQINNFMNKLESTPWVLTIDEFEIANKKTDDKSKDKKPGLTRAMAPKRATLIVSAYTYQETQPAAQAQPAQKK
jgi:Tfp pilus assembly protein PilO